MSYNSHQKLILDSTLSLEHRFSHLRSCALIVSNLLGQRRSDVVATINDRTGINIEQLGNESQLGKALDILNEIRAEALEKENKGKRTLEDRTSV